MAQTQAGALIPKLLLGIIKKAHTLVFILNILFKLINNY